MFKLKMRIKINHSAAEAFALERHGEQDHGCLKIEDHLRDVVENVQKHYDPLINISDVSEVIAAGWLHDILEDTQTKEDEIHSHFNVRVGTLVSYLTDKEGKNRLERHLHTYYIIASDPDAVLIKLCDRRHNQARSIKHGERYMAMYLKEFNYFKFSFWRPGQFVQLWEELDNQYEEMQRKLSW